MFNKDSDSLTTSLPAGTAGERNVESEFRLEPLEETRTIAEKAFEHIKAAIISGDLRPSELYSVTQFASMLGVSRTPVREALLSLAQQGFLRMDRNRGFQLTPMTESNLEQVIEVRVLLEIPSMERLAAAAGTDTSLLSEAKVILAELKETERTNDLLGFLALDRRFHLSLLSALGNDQLTNIVGDLRDRMQLRGFRQSSTSVRIANANRDHEDLLKALEAGDGTKAAEVMRRHLEKALSIWN